MYKNANYAELNKTISDFNWEAYLSECNDVDLMCERFTNKYLEMLEKYIPTKMVRIRKYDKPWFNDDIRKELRIRDRLRNINRKHPSSINLRKYKTQEIK